MRVSSSVAVRSNAGYDARSVGPSSAGSAMLQCTRRGWDGNSGQTSRTRSHSVITTSKRCATNSSRCLVRFPLMSIPRLLHHAYRVGVQRLRVAAGAVRPNRSGRHVFEERLRDLRARRCSPCTGTRRVAGDPNASRAPPARAWPGRATARDGARHPPLATALGSERDRSRSSGRGHPPSCAAPTRAHRHAADPSGTTPGSAARRPAASTPTPPDRSRPAPATTSTAPDAPRAARTPADHQHHGVTRRSAPQVTPYPQPGYPIKPD